MIYFKMIGAVLMSLITMIGGIFMPSIKPQKNEICHIAHRGWSGFYQQNTELAFRKAGKAGFGGAETDVRMTKDGVFVTCHDGDVTLKDGTNLVISESTYEELTAQPIKNKKTLDTVYLCTFERYLEVMKEYGMICFIELKGSYTDEQIQDVFNLAARTYDLKKCIMQSFDYDNLLKVKKYFPDLGVMLTYGQGDEGYERCFEDGFSIDIDYNIVTEELIEEFHSRGLEVAVWTANTPLSFAYCKSLNVDYIESDYFAK